MMGIGPACDKEANKCSHHDKKSLKLPTTGGLCWQCRSGHSHSGRGVNPVNGKKAWILCDFCVRVTDATGSLLETHQRDHDNPQLDMQLIEFWLSKGNGGLRELNEDQVFGAGMWHSAVWHGWTAQPEIGQHILHAWWVTIFLFLHELSCVRNVLCKSVASDRITPKKHGRGPWDGLYTRPKTSAEALPCNAWIVEHLSAVWTWGGALLAKSLNFQAVLRSGVAFTMLRVKGLNEHPQGKFPARALKGWDGNPRLHDAELDWLRLCFTRLRWKGLWVTCGCFSLNEGCQLVTKRHNGLGL